MHIPEEQFKMIRYYGIYAQHTKERPRLIKMVNDKIKELRRKMRKWRLRIMKSFGYDPLECEKCGGKMIIFDIYYKEYGSVMELYQKRIEAQINKEVEEIEQMDRVIRHLTKDRIEPLYA